MLHRNLRFGILLRRMVTRIRPDGGNGLRPRSAIHFCCYIDFFAHRVCGPFVSKSRIARLLDLHGRIWVLDCIVAYKLGDEIYAAFIPRGHYYAISYKNESTMDISSMVSGIYAKEEIQERELFTDSPVRLSGGTLELEEGGRIG